jgi:hypothetical protein
MLSRELSDGFQYREEKSGTKKCERCSGTGHRTENKETKNDGEGMEEDSGGAVRENENEFQNVRIESGTSWTPVEETCPRCRGTGEEAKLIRIAREVDCPKEQVLIDLLDEHEPIGRFVVYAGFQASVDRCVRIALQYQWDVIRIDGRGWEYSSALGVTEPLTSKDMLRKFQNKGGKIVIVGQPGAAGMGLTLTASPSVFFFSNSFNGEDRIQAAERIQGIGMDINRGATVIDVIHLPIDEFVLNNLRKKIKLMDLTMGRIRKAVLESEDGSIERR